MRPMIRFLRRKMWNNRAMTISSFIGLLLAVSFAAAIPLYTNHALSRIISVSLAEGDNAGAPPGSLLTRYQAARGEYTEPSAIAALNEYMSDKLPGRIGYPQLQSVAAYSLAQSPLRHVGPDGSADNRRRQMSLMAQTGLADHVTLSAGAMYDPESKNEYIEAIVSETALARNYLKIGDVYQYQLPTKFGNKTIEVKVVGAFTPKDESSDYWHQGLDVYTSMLMIAPETFVSSLLETNSAVIGSANWYALYDLAGLGTSDLNRLESLLQRLETDMFQIMRNTRVDISFLDLIAAFKRESLQLQAMLFTLAAPMLAMCFYYIYMNARQSLERQRNDIAVLRSRGAEMGLIYRIYLLEGLLLGAAAWLLGMPIAGVMARLMAATDGFMQFAPGKQANLAWNSSAGVYGLAAVVVAVLASTLPVSGYGKQSIVDYKKELARADRAPLWQRLYLDVALALAAAAGWYAFYSGQLQAGQQTEAGGMQLHPLFFFVPAVAIFAAGLLCLRLFPIVLKLLHRMLRRRIPVALHLVLVQLSRSQKTYFPLMLLLVMTMGLGIYHASAARTIDQNETEQLMYANGADVVLQPVWEAEVELYDAEGNYIPEDQPRTIHYAEPPSAPFEQMPGVVSSARVLTQDGDIGIGGKSLGKVKLMGIDNVGFAYTGWWRSDLYKNAHPYTLLRLLGAYEHGAIVSKSFASRHGLAPGDLIRVTLQGEPIELVIVAITEYWPSLEPSAPFVIANIDYVYDHIPLMPYALWLKMEEGARMMPVVQHLREHGIETASVKDARNETILRRLQPSREGVFGILTLGFLVSVAVSFIGYLIFWLFSLARRTLQMGIFRATGLSRGGLTFMLLVEQLLTTGLSIALGLAIGRAASRLFLPFLQASGQNQTPPFAIVFHMNDTVQLLSIVTVMIAIGAFLLTMQIRRLRVHQAVKLGEER
ncbi:ABC transporter permease [Paenibacillus sp. GCM10012307]|uniref:ABC transporter permease n=1 Tax=Paenibacillus roseus TaxID=2798579 RepID=A0A934J137_9BACL|nr:ABC transporter permease [Paenibacillus roseus]MBJ6362882.1 ABC transporter permease [Paenibacillus roseus]